MMMERRQKLFSIDWLWYAGVMGDDDGDIDGVLMTGDGRAANSSKCFCFPFHNDTQNKVIEDNREEW